MHLQNYTNLFKLGYLGIMAIGKIKTDTFLWHQFADKTEFNK